MTVKEFLRIFKNQKIKPIAICKDDFNISIQNSENYACDEKSVELGYPSNPIPELSKYSKYNGTIFNFVPLDEAEKLIQKHGGIEFVDYQYKGQ